MYTLDPLYPTTEAVLTPTEQQAFAHCWATYQDYLALRDRYPRTCKVFFAALAIGRHTALRPSIETPARIWPSTLALWYAFLPGSTLADKARQLMKSIEFAEWIVAEELRPPRREEDPACPPAS